MPSAAFLDTAFESPAIRLFGRLLDPCGESELREMARRSMQLTRRHFGRAIRLFAPLYLSNECVNSCAYCGFSRENAILRLTLEIQSVVKEARHLASEGFRNLLLVAGEHPRLVSTGYLEECVRALVAETPGIALEVAPLETAQYARIAAAGAEGLVVYQETYDRALYASVHTAGPKRDYAWRLDAPERAYEGGFRRIGVGALFGLKADWRSEARALAAHVDYLLKRCWKAQFTISVPRLRPCAGAFSPAAPMTDAEFIQLVCALRITFPQVGLVLSTREPAALRDVLTTLGITLMSAGSHTEPGGYTGEGRDAVHLTVRGRPEPPPAAVQGATGQFEISDERSPLEVAEVLRRQGLEPVWKDWDSAILGAT